jgi:hypothetical protein
MEALEGLEGLELHAVPPIRARHPGPWRPVASGRAGGHRQSARQKAMERLVAGNARGADDDGFADDPIRKRSYR